MESTHEHIKRIVRDALRHCIAGRSPIPHGTTLLLAVSGGIDSMVLLHLIADLREDLTMGLMVAHINHQLRGEESQEDEAFVRRTAEKLSLHFLVRSVNVLDHAMQRGISKQEAARDLRYQALEELRSECGASHILTAHNADDNAETVIMNVIRGTGIRGLAGIPDTVPARKIIRPLLHCSREQIEAYAREHDIEHREDSSNASLEYRRNLVRHSLLPALRKEYNPEISTALNRLSDTMKQLRDWIDTEIETHLAQVMTSDGNDTVLQVDRFLAEPLFMQHEILTELLRSMNIEPSHQKVESLFRLLDNQSGRSVHLSPEIIVWRDRGSLLFRPRNDTESYELSLKPGDVIECDQFNFSISREQTPPDAFSGSPFIEDVDSEKLGERLILRNWREGDWFIPLGMQEKKKLSDFFIDQKIASANKPEIPILESDGSIVWVCGQRIDHRFRITTRTQKTVRLHYNPHPHS